MEQKNENEFLMIKNYSNFLIDLGLNFYFSKINDIKVTKKNTTEKYHKSVEDIDNYVKEWQIKNNYNLISRNNNKSSKNFIVLSEKSNFINLHQSKENQPELLEKMFSAIGYNLDEFFIINIDLKQVLEKHVNRINEFLKLYFTTLKPKIFIDMSEEDFNKFFALDKLNFNTKYFKIPSISQIIKNQSLKSDAWLQLKLVREKLNGF